MNDTYPDDHDRMIGIEENHDIAVRILFKDISGTNMYCSDDASEEIRRRLSAEDHPERGIHFIDTGNYHYMSRIFTSFIDEEYDLVMFDHHTDMQDTAFGGILSCGSWVKEILEKDDHLRSVLVIGPPVAAEGGTPESVNTEKGTYTGWRYYGKKGSVTDGGHREASDTGETADILQAADISQIAEIPLYISVDKDILDRSECITNWDQGELTLDELGKLIRTVASGRRIIGADICGGISVNDPEYVYGTDMKNTASDKFLYELLLRMMR